MKVLITGNRGFICSGLAGDGIDLKTGEDIRFYRPRQKYDVVVHAAALTSVVNSMLDPYEYFSTNVYGTYNVVRRHPEAHIIYLSTAGIYGEGLEHTINSEPKPTSVYTLTKLLGEAIVRSNARSYAILRLTNVIGDTNKDEPNVYQIFKSSEKITIYGDGSQTRDFIDVNDVRKAIVKCYERRGVFNVGTGISRTILSLAQSFGKPIEYKPERTGEIKNFGIKDPFDLNS